MSETEITSSKTDRTQILIIIAVLVLLAISSLAILNFERQPKSLKDPANSVPTEDIKEIPH